MVVYLKAFGFIGAGIFVLFAAPHVVQLSKSLDKNDIRMRRLDPIFKIVGLLLTAYGLTLLFGLA